jgi:hypothetical protein
VIATHGGLKQKPGTKKKKRERSGIFGDCETDTGLFITADPEEFKFCFALMNAGMSWNMPVKKPKSMMVKDADGFVLKNTASNRGMLAVTQHLRETHPERYTEGTPPEAMSVGLRMMELGKIIAKCLKKNDQRIAPYVKREREAETSAVDIAEPLVEAAATAKMTRKGLDLKSLFSIAAELRLKYDADEDGNRKCFDGPLFSLFRRSGK